MSRSELYLPEWDDPNNLKRLINGIKRKCDEVSWHPVKKKKKCQGQSTISGGDYWKNEPFHICNPMTVSPHGSSYKIKCSSINFYRRVVWSVLSKTGWWEW